MPDGAPSRAKEGALPPPDQDTKYSYLWNCRGGWHFRPLLSPPSMAACPCTAAGKEMNLVVIES